MQLEVKELKLTRPSDNNQDCFDSVDALESYMNDEYGCFTIYDFDPSREANEIHWLMPEVNPPKDKSFDLNNFIHNKNKVNIYFPNCGFRVITSKYAITNIPYIDNIINGDFNKDNVKIFRYKKDDICLESSTNFIMLDDPEILLFRKPYDMKIKKWQRTAHYNIEEIEIDNLYKFITKHTGQTSLDNFFHDRDY